MVTGNEEATFPVNVQVNKDEIDEGVSSLERLKAQIRGSTDSLREMTAAQKSLRGSTEEIKGLRAELTDAIAYERGAISAANVALVKMGTTYEKLAAQERALTKEKEKAAAAALREQRTNEAAKQLRELEAIKEGMRAAKERTDGMKEALSAAGGPLQGFVAQLSSAQKILGGGAGVVFLAAAAAAAILALGAAAVATTVSFAKWVITAANASRAMLLMGEAAGGSAKQAAAMSSQVDALARTVPTSTAALNELQTSLVASMVNSRVSGQGIEDTFAAVGTAAAAMGDQAGNALRGIIERGKQFGRVGIGFNELEGGGTGLKLGDVAGQLAKQMHTGVEQARQALVYGMVPIDQAAKAIRDAVEKRFGEVNAKKLLDIDVQAQKFHDHLVKLASGFNLEPILQSLAKLVDMFDVSTVTGSALQQLISIFGDVIGTTFKEGTPIVQDFFEKLVIGAQAAAIYLLKNTVAIKSFVNTALSYIPSAKETFEIATVAVVGLAAAFVALAWPVLAVAAAVGAVTYGVLKLSEFLSKFDGKGIAENFVAIGEGIISGLVNGLTFGAPQVIGAIESVGKSAWNAMRSFWDSHSPSKRAFGMGADIGEGKALGIESKEDRVADAAASTGGAAADAMASAGAAGGAGGGGGAGVSLTIGNVTVVVQVAAGASAQQQGQQAGAGFMAEVTRIVERLARGEGIQTQAVPA